MLFRTCSCPIYLHVTLVGNKLRLMCTMIRLFEGNEHAKSYAKFRPTYPAEVFETVVAFSRQKGGGHGLALDVACGTGQSTLPLASYYDQVIGSDISKAQIEQAPKNFENVSFQVGSAEDLGLFEESSIDLITCAQGAHWLNHAVFFKEVDRVLTPGGTIALYGYGNVKLDKPEACDVVWKVNIII